MKRKSKIKAAQNLSASFVQKPSICYKASKAPRRLASSR